MNDPYEPCCLCGEATSENDIAEMHDAEMLNDPALYSEARAGICHPQCGLDAGWVVS